MSNTAEMKPSPIVVCQEAVGSLCTGIIEALGNGYTTGFVASAAPLIVMFVVLCFGRTSLEQVRGGRA